MLLIFSIFISFLMTSNLINANDSIFHAVHQNNIKSLKKMLNHTNCFHATNYDGQTILHTAVIAKNKNAIKIILKSNTVNINQLDKYGKTAMDYAVEYGYNKIVRKLYKYNGKVTSQDNAQQAQKIITRPFKILFGIGIALFTISILYLKAFFHTMIPALHHCSRHAGYYATAISVLLGLTAPLLLLPGVSGWAYRSHQNLSLTKFIA